LDAGPLELRRWDTGCLDELMAALNISLHDLKPWLPWAQRMPSAEEELAVLEAGVAAFEADEEWAYMLHEVKSGALVGGIGLHQRVGPGGLEIGYWVRSDRAGRGYATAAAKALTQAAFDYLPSIERIEIHMDQANAQSAAVPRKLGYRMVREERRDILGTGHMRPTFVWILPRPDSV
jgi:RimJ/RimL family protein N-acetyltransferase